MKTSKKIIIPFFSTIVGLSLAAGIGGAFAWYQYNSQATVSFLGTSVADTGVLQIGQLVDDDNDPATDKVMQWGKDIIRTGDAAKLVPVTFGALKNDGSLEAQAYAYPEAGCGTGYEADATNKKPGWVKAEEGKQYSQFELYMRALIPDATAEGNSAKQIPEGYKLAARNVFISDYVCKSVSNNKVADEALRIHIDVEGQEKRLLSKSGRGVGDELNLYGPLDLDQNDEPDKAVTTAFRDLKSYGVDDNGDAIYSEGDTIEYGIHGQKQNTEELSNIKQARNESTGKMPTSGQTGFEKKILTTSTEDAVKVTITVWLEGWEYLKTAENETAQEWNPKYTADTDVQVGLQFDSGIFRGLGDEGDLIQ